MDQKRNDYVFPAVLSQCSIELESPIAMSIYGSLSVGSGGDGQYVDGNYDYTEAGSGNNYFNHEWQ